MVCFSTMDDSSRRRYRIPPIEEAICEMHFAPGRDWDLTIPGKLQSELGSAYIGRPQEQRVQVFGVGLEQQGSPPSIQIGEGLAKVQLVTEDSRRIIGVGPDVLSIHILRPYHSTTYPEPTGWMEFYTRIEEALKAYWNVAEPIGINQIGIRYINIINIPGDTDLDKYLNSALPKMDILPSHMTNFVSRVEYMYQDNIRLILSQSSVGDQPNNLGFYLDLDLIWSDVDPVDQARALTIASDLHDREKQAFEAIITDKTREVFNDN